MYLYAGASVMWLCLVALNVILFLSVDSWVNLGLGLLFSVVAAWYATRSFKAWRNRR